MLSNAHDFVRPQNDEERAYLESLIREDYARCHPGQSLDDMKSRARFSWEDKGMYRDWLAVAATRAAKLAREAPLSIAA